MFLRNILCGSEINLLNGSKTNVLSLLRISPNFTGSRKNIPISFIGDALFAMWKNEGSATGVTPLVNSATMCSLSIQEECDNYMTDVGVLLRVKTAVAVGVVYITYVGLEERKQFDMSGPAISDANAAEKWAEPGSVVLSQLAWENCEQGLFIHELIEDGHHYKVAFLRNILIFHSMFIEDVGSILEVGRLN